MSAHARRFALWGVAPKVALFLATLVLGRSLGAVAFMVVLLVLVARFIRRGTAEQYHIAETTEQKAARHLALDTVPTVLLASPSSRMLEWDSRTTSHSQGDAP